MAGFGISLITRLRSDKVMRRLRLVLVYMTGQGLVQILNLSIGLLLLRWLNVDNYAQFSVAFGFQTTLSMLTDLGFAGTIVALVGTRGNDPSVVGSYIRSGRHLRNVMLMWLTPVAAIVFVGIARKHHWSVVSSSLLFLSIVSSIYFSGMVAYYAAPMLIRGKLTEYYRCQLSGAAFRIAACAIVFFAGGLNAWSMGWINALGFGIIGWLSRRESLPFIALPERPSREVTRQMLQYVAPSLPNILFFALQGQISLFLISFFGQTHSIAEVGALGRLTQIFLLFSGFNSAVIEPFMARLPENRVIRSYIKVLAIAVCICTVLCLIGFYAPGVLLLLLGPKYSMLRKETGWLVLGSCLTYLVGVTWTMSAARRWIFWTTNLASIGLIMTTQIVFLVLVKVDSTLHVVYFGVATSAAYLAGVFVTGIFGIIRGPKIKIPEAVAAAEQDRIAEEIVRSEEN